MPNMPKLPQQVSFETFSAQALITPLRQHGRLAAVMFNNVNCGFVDSTGTAGLRQAHRRAVNNALYGNSPKVPEALAQPLPSPEALGSYPEFELKFPVAYKAAINQRALR